ncbi:MAG: zf-HC2 domain-containing protein, partial [Anaerolineae bacterium]
MTNAEHRHLRLLLAHYRELDDPARVAVDAHLLTCANCRLALAAYAEHEALLLRSLPARAPSPRLAAGLHRQLTPRHLGVPWYRRLGNELVFAAGVALLVLTFMGVIRLQQQRPQITAGTATPISIVAPAASATPIASITTAPSALVSPTPAAAQTPAATPGTPAPTWPWLVYTLDTNNSRSLYTARVDGSDTRLLHRWPTRLPGAPALSLDGRWLAYGLDGLWLLPLNGEAALNLLPPDRVNGQVTALAWAPDSLALALVIQRPNGTYQVTIVRLQADLPTDNFSFDQGYPRLLGWNADANTVLVLLSANEQEDSSGQIQALTPGQPVASQPYLYEAGPNWRL